MNSTARTLSIAAVAAFTALGAQASNLVGLDFEAGSLSTRTRAEVHAEATQAVKQFKNYVVESNTAVSSLDRGTVQAEAVQAARLRQIAIGNRS